MLQPGYITDLPWQHTYQYCLSPHYTRFALGIAGLSAPTPRSCCELAYGQGLSVALHAACNQESIWIGTDFNSAHAAFARSLTSGVALPNLCLYEEPLAVFCRREELGKLDFIGMIGTWSWLPASDQAAIGEFLDKKLTRKGLFALDHLTFPGNNALAGLRRILLAFADPHGQGKVDQNSASVRVRDAVARALAFCDVQPSFMHKHWELRNVIERMQTADIGSLTHEYFNHNWRPGYFLDMVEQLKPFGLSWIAYWSLTDALDELHFTPQQLCYLSKIVDVNLREQLKDLIVNRGTRSDLWSKEPLSEGSFARRDVLGPEKVILVKPKDDFNYEVQGALGKVALSRSLYGPLLEALADYRPLRLEDLHNALGERATFDEVTDALAILFDRGYVRIVNPSDAEIARSALTSRALNQNIMDMARVSNAPAYLGSPVTGSGINVSRVHQLFLLAREEGGRSPETYARFAENVLAAQPREDQPDTRNVPKNRGCLRAEADAFEARHLPIYRALRIADPT